MATQCRGTTAGIESHTLHYISAGQWVDQPATIGLVEPQDTQLCDRIQSTYISAVQRVDQLCNY